MTELALAAGYALFLWWFGTVGILWLDGRAPRTFATTLRMATVVLGAALWGLVHTRDDTSASGAYCAFTCAILVWAWQELAFLLGVVTGPRRTACPPGLQGWPRLRAALGAVLYHEFALIVLALAVWACVGHGANRTGLHTYLLLWAMRQSAKLNVYLGVRNLGEQFLPQHLRYLASYFRQRACNGLFPLSALLTTGGAVLLWQQLVAQPAGAAASASGALLGTMLALGALEHWLLVLPLPTDALWRWGLRNHENTTPAVIKP